MKRETLKISEAIIEVTIIDNIIYMKTLHMYTDDVAVEMTKYLDKIIDQIPHNPIRVWDASDLPSECFKLTSKCVNKIVNWSDKLKKTRPGSQAFFIASKPSIFGISRMYEMQASNDSMDVMVLKSIDELPQEIKNKLP